MAIELKTRPIHAKLFDSPLSDSECLARMLAGASFRSYTEVLFSFVLRPSVVSSRP